VPVRISLPSQPYRVPDFNLVDIFSFNLLT
jgi:hypothetical protein